MTLVHIGEIIIKEAVILESVILHSSAERSGNG